MMKARHGCDETAQEEREVTTKAWNHQITGYSAVEAKMKFTATERKGMKDSIKLPFATTFEPRCERRVD